MNKIVNKKAYMKGYNRNYKFGITKRSPTDNRYKDVVLSIPPTQINFKGTDIDEPLVCSEFDCGRHLTHEEILYGTKCIHCQHKKKTFPSSFISFPIKNNTLQY